MDSYRVQATLNTSHIMYHISNRMCRNQLLSGIRQSLLHEARLRCYKTSVDTTGLMHHYVYSCQGYLETKVQGNLVSPCFAPSCFFAKLCSGSRVSALAVFRSGSLEYHFLSSKFAPPKMFCCFL